jgi:hypothetical protein
MFYQVSDLTVGILVQRCTSSLLHTGNQSVSRAVQHTANCSECAEYLMELSPTLKREMEDVNGNLQCQHSMTAFPKVTTKCPLRSLSHRRVVPIAPTHALRDYFSTACTPFTRGVHFVGRSIPESFSTAKQHHKRHQSTAMARRSKSSSKLCDHC